VWPWATESDNNKGKRTEIAYHRGSDSGRAGAGIPRGRSQNVVRHWGFNGGQAVVSPDGGRNTCAVTPLLNLPCPAMIAALGLSGSISLESWCPELKIDPSLVSRIDNQRVARQSWAVCSLPIVLDPVMVAKSGDAVVVSGLLFRCLPGAVAHGVSPALPTCPKRGFLLKRSGGRQTEVANVQQAKALVRFGAPRFL